ncbi:NAD+ synthase [Wenzhouxiangella sp. XN24]|uniref:NAD+ synthase n=1 Tax=Wenzhouxiangella sp. XN24 TaxID=2713569 RepID=UPI0013EE0B1F|nr:NAD+ synthase [Wenzhouxiangella sp. XN24]NGX15246.1 NAD+ synthase [Wenzhouxiangella sp. XN24]
MTDRLRIALAQTNPVVGDVETNVTRMLEVCRRAHDALRADLVMFPELALCGYPPEDLLFHRGFARDVAEALDRLARNLDGMSVLVGYPEYDGEKLHNSAILLRPDGPPVIYRKQVLPNYGVFDEKRYFEPGTETCVVEVKGVRLGITICEDLWDPEVARRTAAAGAEVLLSINGSPYDTGKLARRQGVLEARVAETGLPILYVNIAGGQDELIFDGGSMALSREGELVYRAPFFTEALELVEIEHGGRVVPAQVSRTPEFVEGVYRALVLGVADYVNKHNFPGVVLGLSGGIDSALTLAVAVDALGPERVRAVMMPSRYTSQMSRDDAERQARTLGVRYDVVSIEPIFEGARAALAEVFAGMPEDVTEENIQARCRGMILMALSNKFGVMLLTTGNKSEMAVGYATLYGDMAGGFAPLKDCSKTLVYRLAEYRNRHVEVIPRRVIERPPSAELRPDQKDTDALPPYDVLDPILEAFIEDDASVDQIVARGFERAVVGRILGMVKRNEYKRRQAPPGIRISRRAFGRDWRYPITSGFAAR